MLVMLQHSHISKSISFQRHVISLDGPVLTASGFSGKLAVVTHAYLCFSSNDWVGSIFMVAFRRASKIGWYSVVLFSISILDYILQDSKFCIVLLLSSFRCF